jgi:cellulose synthase/poly-beta-1,6-N-acetylglucosamine synthase-like glycosyltransferase
MIATLYWITVLACLTLALPVATILLETIGAIASASRRTIAPLRSAESRDRIGVLVPAHNEEETLPETITNIQLQLRDGDRLLVVADNCADNTAAVARSLGAEVVDRRDLVNRGKGFALDWGARHFAKDPPTVVVVVDADCKLGDRTIDRLAAVCKATNRPVQARDLMVCRPDAPPSTRAREFAWRVRNWIRPLGLSSVGLPCQLMGTGMAFPWEIIATAKLATSALVEDLTLGFQLAANGHPPMFCPDATVTSEFPLTSKGSQSQQARWEQGHLGVIATELPSLLVKSLQRRDLSLIAMILDAAVPPLSLLWMIILLFFVIGLGFWLAGVGATVLGIGLVNLAGFSFAVAACWIKVGRDLLTPQSIVFLGLKALKKIPFYFRIALRRNGQTWVRTDRRKS